MNTRARTALQTMKASSKHDEETVKKKTETRISSKRSITSEKGLGGRQSRRERKMALQQDVDKLRKKLRLEESVHRALTRAFSRPLGVLPRLPPYLPSDTLELLAEVAVLEEEVEQLEELVAHYWHDLFQKAICLPSSMIAKGSTTSSNLNGINPLNLQASGRLKPRLNLEPSEASSTSKPLASTKWSLDSDKKCSSSCTFISGKQIPKKFNSSLSSLGDRQGKENKVVSNSPRNHKPSLPKQASKVGLFALESKQAIALPECVVLVKDRAELSALDQAESNKSSGPNKLSEDILRCLMNIFLLPESSKSTDELEASPTIPGACENSDEIDLRDPYDICREFGRKDIGPYKHFQAVEMSWFRQKLVMPSSILTHGLKVLLRKLAQVDLAQLTYQQKLAFWINIYNSCIMKAFLEQGPPTSPEMVVTLMQKAGIIVGGHLLRAMTIEHCILRLPYHSKLMTRRPIKNNDVTLGSIGLEWPEPLVTFALSYGTWSSPVVRVYTASQVVNELETAKRDYLQAAVGMSKSNKLAIPKLLEWYILDFAKGMESFMDWIFLQLPSELRSDAVNCLEMSRTRPIQRPIQVLPYEFRFRYLLAP